MRRVHQERPWRTVGMVLLPDHLHMIWRLEPGDTDYSGRIQKGWSARSCRPYGLSSTADTAEAPG